MIRDNNRDDRVAGMTELTEMMIEMIEWAR